ncbi:hypothetical protein [Carp edema virus]|nr:hypothetical protein [Carp edema virus]
MSWSSDCIKFDFKIIDNLIFSKEFIDFIDKYIEINIRNCMYYCIEKTRFQDFEILENEMTEQWLQNNICNRDKEFFVSNSVLKYSRNIILEDLNSYLVFYKKINVRMLDHSNKKHRIGSDIILKSDFNNPISSDNYVRNNSAIFTSQSLYYLIFLKIDILKFDKIYIISLLVKAK